MKKNKKTTYSELFLILAVIFITCLLLSNVLAAKLLKIGKYSITAGALVFPIWYIVNDVFSEIYGFEKTKKVIYLGFIMNIFMVLIFTLAIYLPAPVWYENSVAFKLILGTTPRVCLASLVAYLLGSLINSKVLVKLKENKKNKFGIRAVLSTLCGEFVDSLIFVTIAFIGNVPTQEIITMIIVQVVLKTLYEIICLPLTGMIVNKIKKYEKVA